MLKLTVAFDEAYDRIPHPDLSLENSISEVGLDCLNSVLYCFNIIIIITTVAAVSDS